MDESSEAGQCSTLTNSIKASNAACPARSNSYSIVSAFLADCLNCKCTYVAALQHPQLIIVRTLITDRGTTRSSQYRTMVKTAQIISAANCNPIPDQTLVPV